MSAVFPKTVTDSDGRRVNVEELSKRHVLILITLKSTSCPVCPQLLLLLNLLGLQDNPPAEFQDPFDYSITRVPAKEIPLNRLLLKTDAYFIVVCPGPAENVRHIKETCNFPYPFIVDDDLSLASSINLGLTQYEMLPCIGHILPDNSIHFVSAGRSPRNYGHDKLLQYLRCYRVEIERDAVKRIDEARELGTLLKNQSTSKLLDEDKPLEQHQQESQLQAEHQVVSGEQRLPVELLSQIFKYIESSEIVTTVMATCRHWRSIGFDVVLMRMRQQAKNVMNSVAICGFASDDLIKSCTDNQAVGVQYLDQLAKKLNELIEIVYLSVHHPLLRFEAS